MRGSEIELDLSEMNVWIPDEKQSGTMKINALASGTISLGAELRKQMSEKLGNEWKVAFYATDDMKILALHPDAQGIFKYLKNGRKKFRNYVEGLRRKGYKIPASYQVEWNEKLQSWVGILQEVAECPKLIKGVNNEI